MGNKIGVKVEAVGTYRLILSSGNLLDLPNTFYVPSFSRNLLSLSRLDLEGYVFYFKNNSFTFSKTGRFIGSGVLCDGLYLVNLDPTFSESLLSLHINANVCTKRSCNNETSSMLWHKRLGHISKERLERPVKDGVLPTLDFTNFGTCIDCIKRKQTKRTKKGATRSL